MSIWPSQVLCVCPSTYYLLVPNAFNYVSKSVQTPISELGSFGNARRLSG